MFVFLGEDARCSIDPRNDAVRIRDEVLPLLNLSSLFKLAHHAGAALGIGQDPEQGKRRKGGSLVVIESMGEACAIEIDGILGQAQVVTKPLPGVVAMEAGVSGTAVMGDGVIALVLDVSSLPRSLLRTEGAHGRETNLEEAEIAA